MNQLLIAVWFYATGSFQLVIGNTFAVDNTTVCRTLKRVMQATASIHSKYVKLPEKWQNDVRICQSSKACHNCLA